MRHALLVLPFAALLATAHAGQIYRWVDAQGQVHYGETPPTGVSAQQKSGLKPGVSLSAPPPPPTPSAAGTGKPAEKTKPAESAADKAARCKDAREQVAFMEEKTANRIMLPQKDGSVSRMTEEEFGERMKKAQAVIGEACGR